MSADTDFEPRPDVDGPRIKVVPPYFATVGWTAAELAQLVGLDLDQWQTNALVDTMGQADEDGLPWAARQVGILCSGQNGVEDITLARELYELTLAPPRRRILHTALHPHAVKTAHSLLSDLLTNSDDLKDKVDRICRASDNLRIEMKSGSMIAFVSRISTRSMSADLLVLEDADYLPESAYVAAFPTIAHSRHPQVWMTGTAVDARFNNHGRVFGNARRRALSRTDPGLCWIEYSAPDVRYPADDPDPARRGQLVINPEDPKQWWRANPGRIPERYIREELNTFPGHEFLTRRLGIGHWPTPVEDDAS
ncbi:MAG: hypothetical protein U5O16_40915 [Rhodococcus sp. (in: high G+C Gram-positive bacteria)]|uniref:hypothetical protein n=1 Tax=Rhodococcus sp. TaxID=1831 RepID=UPI002AD86D00|nr:hypothetical protein [Rhodococcus sp. (in: high G+C Gram-positive bacteria)]